MKKPVKKKAMGGALGVLAEGDFSGALGGVLPMMIRERDKRRRKKDTPAAETPTGMKRGGKVGRGDGACKKGRTKGKMV
jgi:hypothetical protein